MKTVHTGVHVLNSNQIETIIEPLETSSLIDMAVMRTVPMQIDFIEDKVKIAAEHSYSFDITQCTFATYERAKVIRESCASCSGCSGDDSCCES